MDMQNEQNKSIQPIERQFDIVDLPSKGRLYKEPNLAGKELLECYYLTAVEEDILTSQKLISTGEMIDALLKSVLKDKSIDPGKLLLSDRNAILIWLRATGYGPEYPASIICENCGEVYTHTFDLSNLEMRELELSPNENGYFEFELPRSKAIVGFEYLTGKYEKEIIKQEKIATKHGMSKGLRLRLEKIIKSVNGEIDPTYIRDFIEKMHVQDSRALRKYIDSTEPRVVMEQAATCTSCGNTEVVSIPVTAKFFWPDS